jgi:hypothetical protein
VALLDRQRGRKVYRTALNAAELAKRVKSSLRAARK